MRYIACILFLVFISCHSKGWRKKNDYDKLLQNEARFKDSIQSLHENTDTFSLNHMKLIQKRVFALTDKFSFLMDSAKDDADRPSNEQAQKNAIFLKDVSPYCTVK